MCLMIKWLKLLIVIFVHYGEHHYIFSITKYTKQKNDNFNCFFRFIIRVEEILNEMSGIEFLGCTMNICFLIYYFMAVRKYNST